uniref:NIPA like domain containing 3 n=1 Tax=Hucho hucho TaxID=62062 RepID=A0A4W5JQG2_9TELE
MSLAWWRSLWDDVTRLVAFSMGRCHSPGGVLYGTILTETYLLGIIISICGNFLISISLNIQKYAHMRQSQLGASKPYYTSVLWWSGVVLMGVGELGNFASYGFAPASLIAPLGCVSVIVLHVLYE